MIWTGESARKHHIQISALGKEAKAMRIVTLLLVKIAILVRPGAGQGAAYRPEELCQWLHRLVKVLLVGHCTLEERAE